MSVNDMRGELGTQPHDKKNEKVSETTKVFTAKMVNSSVRKRIPYNKQTNKQTKNKRGNQNEQDNKQ